MICAACSRLFGTRASDVGVHCACVCFVWVEYIDLVPLEVAQHDFRCGLCSQHRKVLRPKLLAAKHI